MKKYQFVISLLYFSSACVFAETELEKLWAKARTYSTDLHSAAYSVEYAESSLKYKRSLYPVSFSSNLASSFNDTYENLSWYTTSSKASINISKKNPFGNSVSGGISYDIERKILNYFSKEINSDNIGYSQTPSVNFSINQSLLPAFFQGYIGDPNTGILSGNFRSENFSKDLKEKSLIEKVTYYYIQARCANRLLEKYRKYVDFYDLRIQAAQELATKSKLSLSEVWSLENKKWEYFQKYVETLNEKENINLNIKNLCGEILEEISIDSALPKSEAELFAYNPSKESLVNDIELLKVKNILNRQASSPVITVGGTFSEITKPNKSLAVDYIENKNYLNWSFSLGLNFSEFFSPVKKLRKQLYENNLRIYEEKLKDVNEQTENQRKNYEEIIALYESQIQKVFEMHKNRVRLKKAYNELFENGKCSMQEMEEVHLNAVESECIYKNLMDNRWLYQWKRTQCK